MLFIKIVVIVMRRVEYMGQLILLVVIVIEIVERRPVSVSECWVAVLLNGVGVDAAMMRLRI